MVSTRKRDDKPRTKIVRLVKSLTSVILKKIVSVGDYKHTDVQRLRVAYLTAFTGFKNINRLVNPGATEFDSQLSDVLVDSTLEEFISIHYPKKKVESLTLSKTALQTSETSILLKERNCTSVKKLKTQMGNNKMLRLLFQFASKLVSGCPEFPKSAQILVELAEL